MSQVHRITLEDDDRLRAEVSEGLRRFNEDAAGPYDPARALATSRERVSEPLEQRPVGHLGVHLVAAIVDDMHYARIDGRNRLQILMRVAG